MPSDTDPLEVVPPAVRRLERRAAESPEAVWSDLASDLDWFEPWDAVYEEAAPGEFAWFPGAETNLAHNCIDRNVERGRGNRTAFIYETGERDAREVITYRDLRYRVERAAAALRELDVGAGDTVTLFMPMCPEVAVAMLACTRVGAIHNVVFTGFGADALADRIRLVESELLLTADLAFRNGDRIDLARTVERALEDDPAVDDLLEDVVCLHRGETDPIAGGRSVPWAETVAGADPGSGADGAPASVGATDPAFVMPTSGTTGRPKGTVHRHGGYQVYLYAVANWLFDSSPDSVWFVPSDIGWSVGHGYIVYGPLLTGATSIIYEGVPTYPDAGVWWELIERYGVTTFATAPTALRALRGANDPHHERHDLSSLSAVFSAGEKLNRAVWEWAYRDVLDGEVPVIDYYGQTETAAATVGNPLGVHLMPMKPGSVTRPLPGVEIEVVDEAGEPVDPGEEGVLVIERPFPGLTPTLWEGHDRYEREYWDVHEGVYWTGDVAVRDEHGYIEFTGRVDDVLTISGHTIGPAAIENALVGHDAVVEAAAVGKPDPERTEVAVLLVVLRSGRDLTDDLRAELETRVAEKVGPLVVVEDVLAVDALPKTQTGKILRGSIRDLLTEDGDGAPSADDGSIDAVREALEERGLR